jgi:predicted transcriptional regulator
MFVKLAIDGQVTLEDRDNFRAFKLVIEGGPARLDQARRALANTAELPDQTDAWIYEQALRQRPEVANDTAWQSNLGAMIEKARPHGWIDEKKKAIKAHIEWTEKV